MLAVQAKNTTLTTNSTIKPSIEHIGQPNKKLKANKKTGEDILSIFANTNLGGKLENKEDVASKFLPINMDNKIKNKK